MIRITKLLKKMGKVITLGTSCSHMANERIFNKGYRINTVLKTIIGPPTVAGSYEIGFVCLQCRPSICLFWGIHGIG